MKLQSPVLQGDDPSNVRVMCANCDPDLAAQQRIESDAEPMQGFGYG